MSRKELFRRYALFFCSVFINAFGVSVTTKALLGTSAISSVPYVLSLASSGTMGQYTIYMNIIFVLLDMTMMKRSEIVAKRFELISQIPVTLFFGLFIDLSMHGLLFWLAPDNYVVQVVTLLAGCFFLGLGISLEVKAGVLMVAGEYLVQVISRFVHKEFGFVKVCFDVTLVVIACVLSLAFMSTIEGVREGTVVAALLVGPISHYLSHHWKVLDGWLCPTQTAVAQAAPERSHVVVTIAREYGSGGRLLGQMLAERLGIKFYDKELIALVAKDSRMHEDYVEKNEQRMPANRLLAIVLQDYEAPIEKSLSSSDALFVSQSRVIREISRDQPCVIIGRCADYILGDLPKSSLVKVFCYTDKEDARKRCIGEYGVADDKADDAIRDINRARISHYQHYTGHKWGDPHNYDLMINTGSMTLQTACDLVEQVYRSRLAEA